MFYPQFLHQSHPSHFTLSSNSLPLGYADNFVSLFLLLSSASFRLCSFPPCFTLCLSSVFHSSVSHFCFTSISVSVSLPTAHPSSPPFTPMSQDTPTFHAHALGHAYPCPSPCPHFTPTFYTYVSGHAHPSRPCPRPRPPYTPMPQATPTLHAHASGPAPHARPPASPTHPVIHLMSHGIIK